MSDCFPKPLSLENLNNLKHLKKQKFELFFFKSKLLGLLFFITGTVTIISKYWFTEFLYAPLIGGLLIGLGLTLLLVKSLIITLTDIDSLMYIKYQNAPKELIHECEAFVSMPNMEPWKKFMDEIKAQNRQVLLFEYELIKAAWNHQN